MLPRVNPRTERHTYFHIQAIWQREQRLRLWSDLFRLSGYTGTESPQCEPSLD